jgi:hypothetical protein
MLKVAAPIAWCWRSPFSGASVAAAEDLQKVGVRMGWVTSSYHVPLDGNTLAYFDALT